MSAVAEVGNRSARASISDKYPSIMTTMSFGGFDEAMIRKPPPISEQLGDLE
jgi:hypothetical protein